ncbi:MAG: S8 family serine peptidase [Gammaproteobacteria bacterium]|nr:S8 family serine peptidase [Gammaproteobacteria bacterium]MCP5459202.1 S8 family serine peptidase [Gammaproteobacteria bacterium]
MTRRGGAYRLVIALCALPLLAACATSGQDETSAIPKQFRASQILVTLPSATPEQWAATGQAIAREYALQPAGEFPLASLGVQCLVYRVPAERSVAEVLAQLNADSRVALAQSNQVFRTKAASANDPYGPLQYGMNQIHAIAAHAVSTGKGVTIAVIDTGAQVDHPDLSGAVQSENFVEGGERSFQTDRHGTAVAGLIAARAGNGIGIVGVAPDAQVLVSKACWYPSAREDQALCSSWTLAKSVDYVVQRGVRIINLSLVGPDDALLRQLLDTALKRGVIVVAAADQGGNEPGFPAAHPGVIAVIASDEQGRAEWPSWAAWKRPVAAPGQEILSTVPSTAYDYLSGSSLAAAQVSGVVALLLQRKPSLSAVEAREALEAASPSLGGREIGAVEACVALDTVLGQHVCS